MKEQGRPATVQPTAANGSEHDTVPERASRTAAMRLWRGDAAGGGFHEYTVAMEEGMVVLDVVLKIQATQANDLAVRWNCKAGKCGSCSAEINGRLRLMCMTRMDLFEPGEPITISPMKTFPLIKDLVTNVSLNFEKARHIPPFKAAPPDPDGKRRIFQHDTTRGQEFRGCIECFLCQDVCHVIRDHEENKQRYSGPRFFTRLAELEMHPLDTGDRRAFLKTEAGLSYCNITKCCTEVCPVHIKITDNAIIPLNERVVTEYHDPLAWALRKLTGKDRRAGMVG